MLLVVQMDSVLEARAQTKQLHYGDFVCDVYGSKDLAPKVLENDRTKLAYDFNVTELSAGQYVAVFHAEPYNKAAGCAGDSVAVRYASSPDGSFGSRSGSSGDYVITRTENPSRHMSSDDCGDVTGGGNPILIKRSGEEPSWTLFYLSVSDYAEGVEANTGRWRHYLMVSHPTDVNNMTSAPWYALARNASRQDYWHYFAGPPVYQRYQPWPARVQSTGALLQSAHEAPDDYSTQGLIGSMSYNANRDRIHYFYLDISGGQQVTFRQDMIGTREVNWWGDRQQIRGDWIEASFHQGRQRWAVFSNCHDQNAGGVDVCLQFTPNADVNSINTLPRADQTIHGLGLAPHFNDQLTGGVMEQFGVLRNAFGQVPGDDFRVYVAERDAGGPANGLYGMDVYSVRLNCHCAPQCEGRSCGDDGCGGSCGQCQGGSMCNDVGQCINTGCESECGGLSCGPDPRCGVSCGVCDGQEECRQGNCECSFERCGENCCAADEVCAQGACCRPNCEGRTCGDDGCGGSCGTCQGGSHCQEGLCIVDGCEPQCEDRECGLDPVCRVSCGTCGATETCDLNGLCMLSDDGYAGTDGEFSGDGGGAEPYAVDQAGIPGLPAHGDDEPIQYSESGSSSCNQDTRFKSHFDLIFALFICGLAFLRRVDLESKE